MCQANIYLIPKNASKEELANIFKKYNLGFEESPYKLDEFSDSHAFYLGSSSHCHSIISRLCRTDAVSFEDYKVKSKNKDIEKLAGMKAIKTSEGYEQRVEEFRIQRDILSGKLKDFTNDMFELMIEESDLQKVLEMEQEYQDLLKQWQAYEADNEDLNESMYYDIDENEKNVIEYDFSDYYEKFNNLKTIYTEVLKSADEICVYPFWMDEEPMEIKGSRQVDIENLKIDDLVFLPYRNLLKISKLKSIF